MRGIGDGVGVPARCLAKPGCGIDGASDFGGRRDRGAVAGDDPVEDVDGGELLVDAGQELLGSVSAAPAMRWTWFSARPRVSIV